MREQGGETGIGLIYGTHEHSRSLAAIQNGHGSLERPGKGELPVIDRHAGPCRLQHETEQPRRHIVDGMGKGQR